MQKSDFLIIGAGIAGASAGYSLAPHGRVILLEGEDAPGYHTTGRSAAFYAPSYGGKNVRPLTLASNDFFKSPPEGFASVPLLRDRGALYVARPEQLPALDKFYADLEALTPGVERLTSEQAVAHCSALRPDSVAGAVFERECYDIDVNAVHHGFLRGIRRSGGTVLTNAMVGGIRREDGLWIASIPSGEFAAPVLVNAAGAWGDDIAEIAGLLPLGLQPMRRTVIIVPPPENMKETWPLVIDVDDDFYFKPESGRLLASPGDETPMPACDVQPDELDIAITIDRIQKAAEIPAPRIENSWAGLRTFSRDRTPVAGFDPDAEGFFWFVGQGGYGIQTAPAMGRMAESLIIDGQMPDIMAAYDVSETTYAPARFRRAAK